MLLNESSLSRLWRKYKEFDSGTISACRGEYDKAENAKRTAQLKTFLVAKGFSVTAIDGVFIENMGTDKEKKVKEKSFIVFDRNNTGKLKETLLKLGEKFDQDSITFNSVKEGAYYLIGTTKREGVEPRYHQEMKLGKPMFGASGMFHSSIKGRPFVFSEETELAEDYHDFDDNILKYNISRIQGMIFYTRANFE